MQNPNPNEGVAATNKVSRVVQDPLDAPLMGPNTIHGPKDQKTASQRWDRFWTSNCSDNSQRLRMNLGLRTVPLEAS